MKIRLVQYWEAVKNSYWFIPTLMAGFSLLLTLFMIELDHRIQDVHLEGYWWIYGGGPDGARAVLSTIASSIMTVAGVTYSITIAVMSLTSQQFGPRLISNFMRDRGNQFVLGAFVSTFLYCLMILRTIRGEGDLPIFVPVIAVSYGVFMAIFSVGVLIYFIHHIAQSIQVSTIIYETGKELDHAIDRLFPAKMGEGEHRIHRIATEDLPDSFEEGSTPIPSAGHGYITGMDTERIMRVARERQILLRLNFRPGHYVIEGDVIADVWPGHKAEPDLANEINGSIGLGPQRTMVQDAEFAVLQLVEMALRALSPSMNDPFTAMMCIDRIGSSMSRLAGRDNPSPYRYDDDGQLRIIANPSSFTGVTDAALLQIRQNGHTHVSITVRLLEMIARVAAQAKRKEDQEVLLHHASMIQRSGLDGLKEESDRRDVRERYHAVLKALGRAEEENPSLLLDV